MTMMIKMRSWIVQPHKAYCLVGLLFGILFIVITPPFEVPDETVHYLYAYHVSLGNLKAVMRADGTVGATLPTSLALTSGRMIRTVFFNPEGRLSPRSIIARLGEPLNPQVTNFIDFHSIAIYSPATYMPQALGMLVGRVLGLSPLLLMYLGRLVNMLVALALTTYAIKVTPVAKWTFFLLSLAPMAVFLRSSLSADAPANAAAIMLTAVIARYAFDKETVLDRRGLLTIVLLSIFLALTKLVYFVLPALCVLIPASKFASRRQWTLFCAGLMALSVMAALTWYMVSHDILVSPIMTISGGGSLKPLNTFSLTGQLASVLSHPVQYLAMVAGNLWDFGAIYLQQYIGVLGWLDTPLPEWLLISFGFMLLLVALVDGPRAHHVTIGTGSKIVLLALFLVVLLLTWSAVYFSIEVGATVRGSMIQGRYLIPIMPLLALFLSTRRLSLGLSDRRLSIIIIAYAVIALAATLVVVINRYYIPPTALARPAAQPIADVGEIVPGRGVVQQFECPVETLRDISVPFGILGRNNTSSLNVRLVDGDRIVMDTTIAAAQISHGVDVGFHLTTPYPDCFGRFLRFEVTSTDGAPGNALTMPRYAKYYRGDLLAPTDVLSRNRDIGLTFNVPVTTVVAVP